jgi:hypothetical protein
LWGEGGAHYFEEKLLAFNYWRAAAGAVFRLLWKLCLFADEIGEFCGVLSIWSGEGRFLVEECGDIPGTFPRNILIDPEQKFDKPEFRDFLVDFRVDRAAWRLACTDYSGICSYQIDRTFDSK